MMREDDSSHEISRFFAERRDPDNVWTWYGELVFTSRSIAWIKHRGIRPDFGPHYFRPSSSDTFMSWIMLGVLGAVLMQFFGKRNLLIVALPAALSAMALAAVAVIFSRGVAPGSMPYLIGVALLSFPLCAMAIWWLEVQTAGRLCRRLQTRKRLAVLASGPKPLENSSYVLLRSGIERFELTETGICLWYANQQGLRWYAEYEIFPTENIAAAHEAMIRFAGPESLKTEPGGVDEDVHQSEKEAR